MMKFRLVQYPDIDNLSRTEEPKAYHLERVVNAEEKDGFEFHSLTFVGTADAGNAYNFIAAFKKRQAS